MADRPSVCAAAVAVRTKDCRVGELRDAGSELDGPLHESGTARKTQRPRTGSKDGLVSDARCLIEIRNKFHGEGPEEGHHLLIEERTSHFPAVVRNAAVVPSEVSLSDSFHLHVQLLPQGLAPSPLPHTPVSAVTCQLLVRPRSHQHYPGRRAVPLTLWLFLLRLLVLSPGSGLLAVIHR